MKKILLTSAGAFIMTFALSLNISHDNKDLDLNEAFAHEGTCKPQAGGFCHDGERYHNNAYFEKCTCGGTVISSIQ